MVWHRRSTSQGSERSGNSSVAPTLAHKERLHCSPRHGGRVGRRRGPVGRIRARPRRGGFGFARSAGTAGPADAPGHGHGGSSNGGGGPRHKWWCWYWWHPHAPIGTGGGGGGSGIAAGGSRRNAPYELPRWAKQFHHVPNTTTSNSAHTRAPAIVASAAGGGKPTAKSSKDAPTAEEAYQLSIAADEDFYLRCKAYALASDTVDRALVQAWGDTIGTDDDDGGSTNGVIVGGALVRDLEAFFGRYRPQLVDDEENDDSGAGAVGDTGAGAGISSRAIESAAKRRRLDDGSSAADASTCTSLSGGDDKAAIDIISKQAAEFLQPTARDPTILPLALLSVGPSILDRVELVKLVSSGLSASKSNVNAPNDHTTASNNKAAVCVLRGGPYRNSNTGRSFHGQLLRDIVSQCIAQETHRSQYLHLLAGGGTAGRTSGKSRFKHVSYTERLVEWASLTEEFHSIVVVLEDPEALPHRTYDAFMATITSLRACHGVPIGLVLASIDHVGGSTAALSRSSLDGLVGIDVRSFAVPPSDVVLDRLMNKFFISSDESINLAVILGAPLLRGIKASFVDNNRSVVEAAMQIKLALAHHFVQKGSFLAMAQIPAFTSSEWQRIAWFCVDKFARSFIMSSSSRDSDMTFSSCASKIRTMIWRKRMFLVVNAWIKHAQDLLPTMAGKKKSDLMIDFGLIEGRASQSESFDELFEALSEFIRKLPVKDVKALLLRWKEEMEQHEASFLAADEAFRLVYEYVNESGGDIIWKLMKDDLNSFILLFDRLETKENEPKDDKDKMDMTDEPGDSNGGADETEVVDVGRELRESLIYSFDVKCRMLKDLNMPFSSETVREDSEAVIKSGTSALIPQVRRGTARALAFPPPLPSRETSITHDPVIVFQALTTRVVDIEEWYKAFAEEVNQYKSSGRGDILWQRFIFAVHQLEMCGLVCRSRRRGGNAFEKTGMVWASGS